MMTVEELRRIALDRPGAQEKETWGRPTFRAGDKMFATLAPEGDVARVKATLEEQAALIAEAPATFRASPHLGEHGWVEVTLETVDPEEMRTLLDSAWRSVAPAGASSD